MSPAALQVGDVLGRIRAGDREAAARFLLENGALLRRRYRRRIGPGLRRIIDSEDLMATLSRRLDEFVAAGRVRALSAEEFWALLDRIVLHSVSDKGRMLRRLQRVESADAALARALAQRLEGAHAPDEALLVLDMVEDPTDREIVRLWLGEVRLNVIAERLGLSAANVRKRWERIRTALRTRLEGA